MNIPKLIFFIIYSISFGIGIFSLLNVELMKKHFVYVVAFQTLSILVMNLLGTVIWK